MALRFSIPKREGFYKKFVSSDNSDIKFISFSFFRGNSGQSIVENTAREEWLWVILSGKISIQIKGGESFILERKSVFVDRPVSLYLPPETEYSIKIEVLSEVLAVSAVADRKFSPVLISGRDVKVQRAGKLNYQRTIFNIVPQDFPASKIIAGETIHDKGHWSCFPPHKHDVDMMPYESEHEEIYFFKCEP
ncbi:MAG: 5-deoxy-glucuronate isomerase, partial [Candidatus Omnitrophica bacterium]|nr:5-deoxy-glucuronate isomerase [Candidatus Omnitrophota bacterium]